MRERVTTGAILLTAVLVFAGARSVEAAACVDCHKKTTPSIVTDWQLSKHSQNDVDCAVCHGDAHTSAADVAKVKIPTPATCEAYHEKQVAQFNNGKHALAWVAMKAMPSAHAQPVALMEGYKGCGGCHKIGNKIEAEHAEIRKTSGGFGVAGCDACHTRHTFSKVEAKEPQACQTCHMGFDHPQWEMYSSSKHGVRALLKQTGALPPTTAAPTRQDCHMQEGDHGVMTGCVWAVPGLGGSARRPIAGVTLTRERQASGNRSNASYRRSPARSRHRERSMC